MLSFSFDGIRKDYVHMLRGRKRHPWPSLTRNILTVPGRPGGYLQGTEIQPRIIEVPIVIEGKNIGDLQKLKEDLASWLVTDEPKELVFDDEPDRTYYAVVDETIDFDEIAYLGQGTIRFLCPDPYKYGPLRNQTIAVPPASFSRNSIAYLSDGTQVSANQPRFEQGGVMVEEGTTNLVKNPSFESTTDWDTLNRTTEAGAFHGGYACKVTYNWGQYQIITGITAGQTYTISAYGKNGQGTNTRLILRAEKSDGTLIQNWYIYWSETNWTRKSLTITTPAETTQFKIYLTKDGGEANYDTNYGYIDAVQLEQKPFATSFVDGTRQPETLTLPTDGILNDTGPWTIECWAKTNVPTGKHRFVFSAWQKFYVSIEPVNNKALLSWIDETGTQKVAYSASAVLNPTDWHYWALVWDGSAAKVFVDGQIYLSVNINLPKSIPATLQIGGGISSTNLLDGTFKDFRISHIARSDAEILDAYQNGFTVDEYTTAYLPFDGSLNVQTPNIVVNEGTAETYPTFTAYVKQPITFLDIIAPDAYMRVGQPYEVSQTPVDGDKPVMQDKMTTTTGWGAATSVVDGIVQGTMVSDGERFVVQSYGPTYNGWAGPALKKSLPYAIQNFRMYSLIQIHSSATGTGRIEIYGLDTANNIVFRTTIADFWPNTKMVRLQCELGTSRDMAWMTYGKKKGNLNYYYGAIDIRRKGNRWEFYTARVDNTGHLVDFVRYTYIDTKNKYTASLAQIQVHIGCHMSYGPVDHMSINHLYVYELRDHQENEVPYIAYTDDVLQFDHKNAIIYRNGEPIMWAKDSGARFFPLGPGTTGLAVNPSDAAIVTVEFRPRYK